MLKPKYYKQTEYMMKKMSPGKKKTLYSAPRDGGLVECGYDECV